MSEATPHVLIAEDNAAMAKVLQFNLERAGFQVQHAEDGLLALQLAQAERFDLVITDQQMPRMGGTELCANLRQLPTYEKTPIVMLTAKGLELNLEQLKAEYGVDIVLPKPFSPREVVQLVADQLTGKQIA